MSEPAPRQDRLTALVDMGPLRRAFYWFCWTTVLVFFTFFYRLRRINLRRVPTSGPVLLVANHSSHFDPPLVGMCVTTRPYRPIARVGLFRVPVFGTLIRLLNAVPLKENEGDLAAIRTAIDLLERGEPVCLFPEGSRSPDGAMRPFKRGVVVLLRRAKCPVVPCGIEGAHDAFPRGASFPRLFGRRLMIEVGEPIDSADLLANGPDEALRRLEREIDALRLRCRERLRTTTNGRYPAPGPADLPLDPAGA